MKRTRNDSGSCFSRITSLYVSTPCANLIVRKNKYVEWKLIRYQYGSSFRWFVGVPPPISYNNPRACAMNPCVLRKPKTIEHVVTHACFWKKLYHSIPTLYTNIEVVQPPQLHQIRTMVRRKDWLRWTSWLVVEPWLVRWTLAPFSSVGDINV